MSGILEEDGIGLGGGWNEDEDDGAPYGFSRVTLIRRGSVAYM